MKIRIGRIAVVFTTVFIMAGLTGCKFGNNEQQEAYKKAGIKVYRKQEFLLRILELNIWEI